MRAVLSAAIASAILDGFHFAMLPDADACPAPIRDPEVPPPQSLRWT
jgi:hypothetical protein